MARPRVHGERVTSAVRIPVDLHERLQQTAYDRDTSINHLMVKAAEYYLDNVLVPIEGSSRIAS